MFARPERWQQIRMAALRIFAFALPLSIAAAEFALLIVLIAEGWEVWKRRRWSVPSRPVLWAVVCFSLWTLISALRSPESWNWHTIGQERHPLLFLGLFALTRPGEFSGVFRWYLAGGLGAVGIGLLQEILGHLWQTAPEWARGLLWVRPHYGVQGLRWYRTAYGTDMVFLAAAGLGLWLAGRRSGALGIAMAAGVGAVLSLSRGAVLALATVWISACLFAFRRPGRIAGAGLAVLSLAFLHPAMRLRMVYRLPSSPAEFQKFSGTARGGALQTSYDRRLMAQAGWEMARRHPWLGIGLGRTGSRLPNYLPEEKFRQLRVVGQLHNHYLQVLAERGWPGLILFLAMWGTLGWELGRRWRAFRDPFAMVGGLALIGFLTIGLTETSYSYREGPTTLWYLILCSLRGRNGVESSPHGASESISDRKD